MNCLSLTTLFLLLISSLYAPAQIDFAKHLRLEPEPTLDFYTLPEIYFKWNMEGKIQVFMNEGMNNLLESKIPQALANFDNAIKSNSELYPAYYYRGFCNKLLHRFPEAEKDFLKAVNLNDTLAQAYIELGEIQQKKILFEESNSYYKKAVKASVKPIDGYLHLGDLKFSSKIYSDARKYYDSALRISSDCSAAHSRNGLLDLATAKNQLAAVQNFDRALKIDSTYKEALMWRAIINSSLNKSEDCLRDCNMLVRYNPENPFPLIMRAFLLIELEDFDQAFSDFKKAMLVTRVNEEKFTGDQTFLDKHIDMQAAIRYTARKIYGFNEATADQIKRGFCQLMAGRYQAAMIWFHKVNEPNATATYLTGLTYEHAGIHAQAFLAYEKALSLDNEIIDAHKKRGIYFMEMKRYPEAINDFTEVIKLEPGSKIGYRFRGIAKTHFEDYRGGIQDITLFIDSDSSDQEAYKARGLCRQKEQDWIASSQDYERAFVLGKPDLNLISQIIFNYKSAIQNNASDPKIIFQLGKALILYGYTQEGLAEIKKASKKGFTPAKEFLASNKK